MAIVRENYTTGGTGSSSTTHSVTAPSGLTTGDYVVVTLGFNGITVATNGVPTGFSLFSSAVGQSNPKTYVYGGWYADVGAGPWTWTTNTANYGGWVVARYSGVNTTTPQDATAVGTDGSGTTFSCTGLTTVTDGAMVILGIACNSATGARLAVDASEPVTEFAEVYQAGAIKDTMMADGIKTSAGATDTITGTISQNLAWGGIVAALRPASATARTAYSQAQAKIKQTYTVYGQPQAKIKSISYVYGQAQSQVLGSAVTRTVYSQAQSKIKATSTRYSQAQAHIKGVGVGYGQAQATLPSTATRYYFTSTVSDVATAELDLALSKSMGSSTTQAVVNTQNGTVPNGVTFTDTAGGTVIGWYTPPLVGLTISGEITVNLWGRESNALANAGFRIVVNRVSNTGTYISTLKGSANVNELGTSGSNTNYNWSAGNATSTTLSTGDRLVVRVQITDAGGTMATGYNANFGYSGNTSSADGDSWIQFAEVITEAATTYRTYGQAQAKIKQTYPSYGQSQAHIKTVSYSCGQAQAQILGAIVTRTTYGQSQARIKGIPCVYGQAQACIKTTYYAYGQAQASIPGEATFSDGFETGDFSKWTSTQAGDGSITVTTGAVKNGTYGAHIDEPVTASTGTWARKTVATTNRIRASGWFRSVTQGSDTNSNNANLRIWSSGTRIVDVYRQNAVGSGGLWLRYLDGNSTSQFLPTNISVAVNTWYHFDFIVEYNGSGNVSRISVRVNGDLKINETSLSLKQGNYDRISIGAEHPSQYVDLDVDDIYVDTNPSTDFYNVVTKSGQAQAYIQTYVTRTKYAQAKSAIKTAYTVYAQAQSSIKTTYTKYAQVQSQIAGSVATKYYFLTTASDVTTSDLDLLLSQTRGSTTNQAIVNTQTGPVPNGINFTQTAGGATLVWFTPKLNAVTISGSITMNLWGRESNSLANAGMRVVIDRVSSTGTYISTILAYSHPSELGSSGSNTANNWSGTPTSTDISSGDRIKINVQITDVGGTMASGYTANFGYSGPTSDADGDSWVQFAEAITNQTNYRAYGQARAKLRGVGTAYGQAQAYIPGIFEDGFETGDMSKWTTVVQGSGSLIVAAHALKNGNYGCSINEAADAASAPYARKEFTSTNRIQVKGWFRTNTEGIANYNNGGLRIFSGTTRIAYIYRQNITGGIWLATRTAADTDSYVNTNVTNTLGVWYHVDVLIEYNGAGSVSHIVVKIDGITKIDQSTFDLKQGAFTKVQIGSEVSSQYVDIDIDDIYIDGNPPTGAEVRGYGQAAAKLTASPNVFKYAQAQALIHVVFLDGFETGDTSLWSSIIPGNGSITVTTAAKKNGTYGCHIWEPATATTGTHIRRSFPPSNRLRTSGWFRSLSDPGTTSNNNANLRAFSSGSRIVDLYRQNSTGDLYLRWAPAAGGYLYEALEVTVALNTWYHFDMLIEYNGTGAVSRIAVKVNGIQQHDASTFDLKQGLFDEVQVGAEHSAQYLDMDVDDIMIDNNPSSIFTTAYRGYAQAQAKITGSYTLAYKHGQAQAKMRGSPTIFAQARAKIGSGIIYYVDGTNGSDSYNGTSLATAWKTLQHAATSAAINSDVYVRYNTYSGFTLTRAVRFHRYPDDFRPAITQSTTNIVTLSAPGIVLDGFEIYGAPNQWGAGVKVTSSATAIDSVVITDCVFHHDRSFGLYLQGANGTTVTNCEFYECDTGVQISGGGTNVIFDGNILRDMKTMVVNQGDPLRPGGGDRGANAFVLTSNSGQVIIRNNVSYGLRAYSTQYGTDGGFLEFYNSGVATYGGALAENNIVWDSQNFCETGRPGGTSYECDNIILRRNVVWRGTARNIPGPAHGLILRTCPDSLIAHNTFIDLTNFVFDISDSGGTNWFAGSINNLVIKNNIGSCSAHPMSIDNTLVSTGVVFDYNNLWNTSAPSEYAYYQPGPDTSPSFTVYKNQSPFEDHGLSTPATFVNAANNDYRLAVGSAGIDAGQIGVLDDGYYGSAPDMGRYETGIYNLGYGQAQASIESPVQLQFAQAMAKLLAPGTYAYDTFTDTNGTLLSNHTSDTGHTYADIYGNMTINNNKITATTNGSNGKMVNAGQADIDVRMDINFGDDGVSRAFAIRFRYSANSDFLFLKARRSSTPVNQLQLWRRSGGVTDSSPIASITLPSDTFAANTTYELRVVAVGSTIVGYIDGTELLRTTQIFNQYAPDVCLCFEETLSTNQTIDNFYVWPGLLGTRTTKYGQAQAHIQEFDTTVYAQAAAMVHSQRKVAQAEAFLSSGRKIMVAQAKANILGPQRAYAQVGAYIDYFYYAQAQAHIRGKSICYAQAEAVIIDGKGFAYGQSEALILSDIKITFGQALASIRLSMAWGQAMALINMGFGMGQAQAHVQLPGLQFAYVQADILAKTQTYGQVMAYILVGIKIGQAQAYIKLEGQGYAQALALIGHQVYAQAEAYINNATYLIKYENKVLPGYAQSESITSDMTIQAYPAPEGFNSFSEYVGLANKIISLRMHVYDEGGLEYTKSKVQQAATIVYSKRNWARLYIQNPDRHYTVRTKSIRYEQQAGYGERSLEYEVEFEAKPWLTSDKTYTATGTSLITIARTTADGGWTPATVRVTGTNVTISGYSITGEFTGYISISGAVSNMIITSEPMGVTINGINKIRHIKNNEPNLYIGPGTTYVRVTGATSCVISYNNRWYI